MLGLLQTKFENSWVTVTNHRYDSHYYFDQVGYFLSPLDFLKECLTFFRFNAAFKRLVFFRRFIRTSVMMEFWNHEMIDGDLY